MSVSSITGTSGSMAAAAAVLQSQAIQYAVHFHLLVGAVESGDLEGARRALVDFSRVSMVAAANGLNPLNQTPLLSQAVVSMRKALVKGDIKAAKASLSILREEPDAGASEAGAQEEVPAEKVGGTAIRVDPSLASFSQVPRVFPTSSAPILQPMVTTSRQLSSLGWGLIRPDAMDAGAAGTAFAPNPEMMLGSRGMSIPAGALLEFEDRQLLPPTFAVGR